MAHTNSTPNYNLPQFVSSDKPAWLTDVNAAYSAIDTGMKNAQNAADDAQSDATQALEDAAAANVTATQADSKASGAVASLSNPFLNTAIYDVGDYVTYNNILYVCIAPVTTPGPWTGSANWERASLDSIATGLKDDIDSMSLLNLNDVAGTPNAGDHMEWSNNGGSLKFTPVSPNLNVLAASWRATSSASTGTSLTDSINLPKGMYLVVVAYPICSEPTFLSDIDGQSISKWGGSFFNLGSQQNAVRLVRANADTQIKLVSSASSNVTFSYIERGGLFAYKLA